MRRKIACCAALIVGSIAGTTIAGDNVEIIFEDTSYFSESDSPFDLFGQGGGFFLEDFEDGLLNTPGLSAFGGEIRMPGAFTDSVDTDDGPLDGSGTGGHNYWAFYGENGPLARFEFNEEVLGGLPTSAGLVWTDGNYFATTIFEAFGPNGESLGIGEFILGDDSHMGGTAEDRFIGITFAGGISAIEIRADLGRIEIDHIQYGDLVPAPAAFGLLGLAGLVSRRSRRRKLT